MPRAIRGVLVECDPSIKAIIVKIDSASHAYIIEELNDQTLVIKENMLAQLKRQLDEVREISMLANPSSATLTVTATDSQRNSSGN
ncbi:General transcription and DNA repair factor IIH subunit TFB5 [Erysiphe neolycopersici]|uniref:General transcription and DNA repair factor IIH subunit TFB5 n=1 Tax=Erysiphe neolycopersici TaxID=212602 RepID=A0A420HXH1_9PEZI|nr:General transcription and DNA repair factor IIH subunit TFB5 [Erysiphe neolycopersici]